MSKCVKNSPIFGVKKGSPKRTFLIINRYDYCNEYSRTCKDAMGRTPAYLEAINEPFDRANILNGVIIGTTSNKKNAF